MRWFDKPVLSPVEALTTNGFEADNQLRTPNKMPRCRHSQFRALAASLGQEEHRRMGLVVPVEAGTQDGLPWIPAVAGKTRVILLEALSQIISKVGGPASLASVAFGTGPERRENGGHHRPAMPNLR